MNTYVFPSEAYIPLLKATTKYAAKKDRPGPIVAEGRPLSTEPGPMVWCILLLVNHSVSGKRFVIVRTIEAGLQKVVDDIEIKQSSAFDASLVLTLLDAPSDADNLAKFMERMKSLNVIKTVPTGFQSRSYVEFVKHVLFSEVANVTGTQGSTHQDAPVVDKGPGANEQPVHDGAVPDRQPDNPEGDGSKRAKRKRKDDASKHNRSINPLRGII